MNLFLFSVQSGKVDEVEGYEGSGLPVSHVLAARGVPIHGRAGASQRVTMTHSRVISNPDEDDENAFVEENLSTGASGGTGGSEEGQAEPVSVQNAMKAERTLCNGMRKAKIVKKLQLRREGCDEVSHPIIVEKENEHHSNVEEERQKSIKRIVGPHDDEE